MIVKFPELFSAYTYDVKDVNGTLTVKTLGAVSEIDQATLLKLGWIKLNEDHFGYTAIKED